MSKLSDNAKHLLRLLVYDTDNSGWAKVSKEVWPLLKIIPSELIEKEQNNDGTGRAKLSDKGKTFYIWV